MCFTKPIHLVSEVGGSSFQIFSLMSWLQYRVYTIIIQELSVIWTILRPGVSTNLGKTSFKFSAPKIWETVLPGLKCLPYHKFKNNGSPVFQPAKSDLAYMFYHWYYLRFYSSLYCCQLFQHDGVQQESSCYFGHCIQMNLMSFS